MDNSAVKFKPVKVGSTNVKKLEIAHVHNCCTGCSDVLTSTVEAVAGVTSHTVKSKAESFVVEGDFSPEALVESLAKVGFYPTVK